MNVIPILGRERERERELSFYHMTEARGVNTLCSKESGLESAVSCICMIIDILFGMYVANNRD